MARTEQKKRARAKALAKARNVARNDGTRQRNRRTGSSKPPNIQAEARRL